MKSLPLIMTGLCLLATCDANAQSRNSAIYGEALGTTGTYALGLDQHVLQLGSAQMRGRLAGSYVSYDAYLDAPVQTRILSVPASAVLHVPVGERANVGFAVEAEYGASFVRWWGPSDRFRSTVGESFRFFPHASVALRTDLADGRVYARGGVTLGGVRDSATDLAPTFGVGVGL